MKGYQEPGLRRNNPILLGSAALVAVSAFLPWTGYGRPTSFELSAAFLWNVNAYRSWFSIGLVVLLVAAAVFAALLVDRLGLYRRRLGGVVAGVAAVWQLQTLRGLVESYTDLLHPLRDMIQSDFALGPYAAFVAGMVLLIKR